MDYSYLHNIRKQRKIKVIDLCEQAGVTRAYYNQLVKGLIKNPSSQKLNALHQVLDLETQSIARHVGVMFGKFYPIHTGHINMIYEAMGMVDELHIFVCSERERDLKLFETSVMKRMPTIEDRLAWMQQIFKYHPAQIKIHHLNEDGIPSYPNGWQEWSERAKNLMAQKGVVADVIFSSETQDKPLYEQLFNTKVHLIDASRSFINISATKIRQSPFAYWRFIPKEVRPFFTKTIAVLGPAQSGKTTLVHKLAAVFNTTSAWEYGKEYVFSKLGGNAQALQYSDYPKIAHGFLNYVDYSVKHANKVTFIDTDFVSIQAACMLSEKKEHPFLEAMIKEYRFDIVILLKQQLSLRIDANNIKSSALQSSKEGKYLLTIKALLQKHHIDYIEIDADSYEQCYLQTQEIVRSLLHDVTFS